MDAASIVLMRSNLEDVVVAFDISRVTYRRIIANFFFAYSYNVVSVATLLLVAHPVIRIMHPPLWTAPQVLAVLLRPPCLALSVLHWTLPHCRRWPSP